MEEIKKKKEEEDSGVAIAGYHYDTICTVCSFLKTIKELSRVSLVSRVWRRAAFREISIRMSPQLFTMKLRDNNYDDHARQIADNLTVKPHIGFLISNDQEFQFYNERNARHCIFNQLPPDFISLAVMVGLENVTDLNNINNLSLATFLPKIDDLQIEKCEINVDYPNINNEQAIYSQCQELFSNFMSKPDLKSLCVISLASVNLKEVKNCYSYLLTYFQNTYKIGATALWGAKVPLLMNCTSQHSNGRPGSSRCIQRIRFTNICISSPNLESWSIELNCLFGLKAETEQKLKDFKAKIRLKKYSLALISSCVRDDNYEVEMFKTIFPNVPLVGFLSLGVVGINTLDTERKKKIGWTQSTVILILTYEKCLVPYDMS